MRHQPSCLARLAGLIDEHSAIQHATFGSESNRGASPPANWTQYQKLRQKAGAWRKDTNR